MTIRYPYLVGDVASNKPNASTAYQLAGTGITGLRTFAAALTAGDITDGGLLLISAYEFDSDGNPTGAREICWCTFADATPDTLTRGTLVYSTTGSKIDWSSGGVDFSPRLEVVDYAPGRVHSQGTISGSPTEIIFGGASNQFRAGYDYDIELFGVRFGSASQLLRAQLYADGAWVTGSDDYASYFALHYGSAVGGGGAGDHMIFHAGGVSHTSDATAGAERTLHLKMRLINPRAPNTGGLAHFYNSLFFGTSRTISVGSSMLRYYRDITGIRFYTNGGATWTAGEYKVREIPHV